MFAITPFYQDRLDRVEKVLDAHYGMPDWHEYLPAVDELVCTILSQNTNDINRDKAFVKLKETFSSWEEVRDADPEAVKEAIRIAGLANQKGPNIQAALQYISQERGEIDLDWLKEKTPEETMNWLTQMKGVGLKTASIVMVFSLDMPAFPVDTHVYRVTGRLDLRPQKMNIDNAHRWFMTSNRPESFGSLHLNIISLGRDFCQARKPKCRTCPVESICQYSEKNFDD
jgi:endonuclease-3